MDWAWVSSDGRSGQLAGGISSDDHPWMVGDAPPSELSELATLTASGRVDDTWTAELRLKFEDGAAKVAGICFEPQVPMFSVDSKELARLRIHSLQVEIERQLPLIIAMLPAVGVERPRFNAPRPGRRGRSDLFYAQRAAEYVAAVAQHPEAPIARLVESQPDTNASGWRRWLGEAGRRGLLVDRPAGTTGRAGGRLSRKAERLLEKGF